jgi:PAS domain S-box-containing protein
LRRNGEEFPVEVSISHMKINGQKLSTVILRDITERRQAEEAIQRLNEVLEQRVVSRTAELTHSNERLRAITDGAPFGIVVLDSAGIVHSMNPAVTTIFGHTQEEILGRNVSHLIQAPGQPPVKRGLPAYMQPRAGQVAAAWDVLCRRKDGHGLVLGVSMSEFRDAGEQYYVAMIRDVTQRKLLEWELINVGERERQRIGRDLHDGLGQHLHGLSYLAALLEKGLQEDGSLRASEAGQLNAYLRDALELTRGLANGLQPVKPMPQGLMLGLRELAERTRKFYRADCRFVCQVPVLFPWHSAAIHLYCVAQEAVHNAMEHGKATRIRVRLSGTRQRIVLGIRDNGVGLKAKRSRTRGMGLRIMQYRADSIGGSLSVRALPNRGTEVVCTVDRTALLRSAEEFQ